LVNWAHPTDPEGAAQRLMTVIRKKEGDGVFCSVAAQLQKQIDGYQNALRMGIQGCHASGDRKTAGAILSVASAGAKMGGVLTQEQQSILFSSKISQITSANRSVYMCYFFTNSRIRTLVNSKFYATLSLFLIGLGVAFILFFIFVCFSPF